MSILSKLYEEQSWLNYKEYISNNQFYVDKVLIKNIDKIIADGLSNIKLEFPDPRKKEVAKYKNSKKRVIYSYGEPYNTYMKMINFLLQEDEFYRNKFCFNSIAYQRRKSINYYIRALTKESVKGFRQSFIKTDFSDFFNSINVDVMVENMKSFFKEEDKDLYKLLSHILYNPNVLYNGKTIQEFNKGVMAGSPLSGYLSNIYMNDVDWSMYKQGIYYIRYADDVLILTNNVKRDKAFFKSLLANKQVRINDSKTTEGLLNEGVTFLGFYIKGKEINLSTRAVNKMKSRIKRRAKWFEAWGRKNKINRRIVAKTFIKGINNKLFSRNSEDGTCWLEWYGSKVNRIDQLKNVEDYYKQYIKFLLSGKQKGYKKHSEVDYKILKKLKYKSIINEFYKIKKSSNLKEK